jgi:hypothetical protein
VNNDLAVTASVAENLVQWKLAEGPLPEHALSVFKGNGHKDCRINKNIGHSYYILSGMGTRKWWCPIDRRPERPGLPGGSP